MRNLKITKEHIQSILGKYNVTDQITTLNYFIEYYSESGIKVIVKVNFTSRNSLIVKFIKDENYPHKDIENQSVFSEHLRKNGILTPKRYISNGKHCITESIDENALDITVEDYIGEEIKTIDFKSAYKIGELIAEMHIISLRDNCIIGADTIFNVTGYNEVSGFEKFCEIKNDSMLNQNLCNEINEIYNEKLNRIKSVWNTLPKCAVQGDISINNLTYKDSKLGIFDYNIAGDEVLVGDMILEGLLTAYEMDLGDTLTASERPELFKCFVKGYLSERILTEAEYSIAQDIYAICNALWFTRILYNENSLIKMLERKEYDNANKLLLNINGMIRGKYPDLFCQQKNEAGKRCSAAAGFIFLVNGDK